MLQGLDITKNALTINKSSRRPKINPNNKLILLAKGLTLQHLCIYVFLFFHTFISTLKGLSYEIDFENVDEN
jgi:hypothetical protein